MSDGFLKGSVTIPYTFLGTGSPFARATAARKTEIVSTNQDDLSRKQPVDLMAAAAMALVAVLLFGRLL